jgi:asparagine synthase (glutamine-hydrolysing)
LQTSLPTSSVTAPDAAPAGQRARVDIAADEFGWAFARAGDSAAWFKGWLAEDGRALEGADAARALARRLDPWQDAGALGRAVDALDGHFALVVERAGRVLAAVDRVRSIPLFLARETGGVRILDRPRRWLDEAETGPANPAASLEIAMAGYCTGRDTLYADLGQLTGGELAIAGAGLPEPQRHRTYAYRSWEIEPGESFAHAVARLADVTRAMFEKTAAGLAGRLVLVPLSAGLDSRLVASAFHELGLRDVQCYAYGRPGNHEAAASREIADKLGLRWHFVAYDPRRIRDFAHSADVRAYLADADSCASVPFLQDLYALTVLRDRGVVPEGAAVVNGNSGDFITGGHIVAGLREPRPELDAHARLLRVLDAQLDKHFSLWDDLRTPANDALVRGRLDRLLAEELREMPAPEADHGLYEFLECHARQGNFVITGQRVYEHLGLAWRLPLWDRDYLDFWRPMPLAFKAGQNLYRAFLAAQNWGGVWDRLDYPETVRPRWAAAARTVAKAAGAPFGRGAWRALDKRVFAYWTDVLSTYATVPYRRVLRDRRGFRNAVALRCEAYLAGHGRGADGRPPG